MDTIFTKTFTGSGFITSVKYNSDGSKIYISDKDSHTVTSVSTPDMNVLTTYKGHKGVIWNFSILENNDLISCSGDMSVIFWNSDGTVKKKIQENGIPKYISVINGDAIIYCEAFSRRSKSYIVKYNVETMNEICKFELEKKITAMNISNDYIITGDDDGFLNLLNLETGALYKELKLHDSTIKSLVLNKNCNNI